MSWGIFIGILGIVISISFFLIQRIKKYPSKLYFTIRNCSRVLANIPTALKEWSLTYNDYSVTQDLYYIEFAVFNNRSSDVLCDDLKSPITICTPGKAKWIDARIKKESPDVKSVVSIDSKDATQLQLNFPLLKKDEYVLIEGLVESNVDLVYKDIDALTLHHRIAGLDTIESIPFVKQGSFRHSRRSLYYSFIWLVLIIGCIISLFLLPKTCSLRYCNSTDGQEYTVSIDKNENIIIDRPDKLSLKNRRIISRTDFEESFDPIYHFRSSSTYVLNIIFFCFLLIFYLITLVEEVRVLRRYKLIHKYLE